MQTCYPITIPVRSASPAVFDLITLEEAHHQLSIQEGMTAHDPEILGWLADAREAVERDAMLVTATGTYTVKMTTFGDRDYFELPSPLRPVTAITSIAYIGTDGSSTKTWGSSNYSLNTYTKLPRVELAYGATYPTIRGDANGITITATAGYSSAGTLPAQVKNALKLHLRHAWEVYLGQTKEADLTLRAYENVVERLRPEVYA